MFHKFYKQQRIIINLKEKKMEIEKSHGQILSYLRHRVMPLLQQLQHKTIQLLPKDIHQFSLEWLQNFKEQQNKFDSESSEDDIQEDQAFQQRINRIKALRRERGRKGISGQVYSIKKTQQFTKNLWPNRQEDKIRMLFKLRNHIFFRNLSEANIHEIIKSMKTQNYKVNQVVFKEGDKGDELFLVEEGTFRCIFHNKKQQQILYRPGQAFGELALLYNTTRASTIVCEEQGKLFSLDRISFNSILRDDILKKTKICEETLNKNQLFSTLNPYEKCKLIENLKQVTYPAGKYVIKQDQIGDKFYIISEGKLVVEKHLDDNLTNQKTIKSINYLKDGEFFGQIALIRNLPRQASVKTLTTSKLFYIERSAFKRLLGTLEQLLKRNQQKYKTVKQIVKKSLI